VKTCFKCKQTKSLDLFFNHTQTPDGRHSWCKDCCREGSKRSLQKINSTIEGRARIFLLNAKRSAHKRNQEFSISINDIVQCWIKQNQICAYTGREMTLEAGMLNTVSIERINSKIGYTVDNTILVCQAINRMKSDFGFEEFYEMCKDVACFLGDDNLNLDVLDCK